MSLQIVDVLIFLVALGLGYFLRSYLTEKGKNYATREDIDEVLDQARQTTRITEQIKAQMSGELWVEQTRWNFKKELYTRLLENLGLVENVIAKISSFEESRLGLEHGSESDKRLKGRIERLMEEESKAMEEIARATSVAAIMLNTEALGALNELQSGWRKAGQSEDYFEYLALKSAAARKVSKLLILAAQTDLLGLTIADRSGQEKR